MWTNGLERYCYRKVVKGGQIIFEDVPDIPGFGQNLEEAERPRFDKLKPASSDALLFALRRCHNYIAGNQGLQKPEAFGSSGCRSAPYPVSITGKAPARRRGFLVHRP
jgi:type I restriction enzyme M protein